MTRTALFVLSVSVIFLSTGCARTLGSMLKRNGGYSELRPASTLHPPGTVVQVRNQRPLFIGTVCTQANALGSVPVLLESDSAQSTIASKATGTFNVSADYLKQLKADASYKYVKNVELSLKNVKVLELEDATAFKMNPNRTADCKGAIKAQLDAGRYITMIKSALKADVTGRVTFERNATLTVAAKEEITKGIAASLGANVGSVNMEQFTGTALHWGLIDDAVLLRLGLGVLGAPGPAARPPRERVIKRDAVVAPDPLDN